MAEDTEVLRAVWNGGINIAFQLAPNEVFIPEAPVPVYAIAPRLSYFSLIMTDKLHKYFQRFLDPESNLEDVWLEDSNGNPVKWHWPIGVLYDLETLSETQNHNSQTKTTWLLTIHYRNFPEGEIVRLSCKEAMESFIMSGIKEADCLKHKVRRINDMHKNDFKKLFQGLATEKFDQFWSINRKLMELPPDDYFRHIPFKLHDQNGKIIQKLISPHDKSGQQNTLLDLFKMAVPSLIAEESEAATNSEGAGDSGVAAASLERTKLNFRYLIQGFSPPLETPLQWASEHLSHPDNFLHICIAATLPGFS